MPKGVCSERGIHAAALAAEACYYVAKKAPPSFFTTDFIPGKCYAAASAVENACEEKDPRAAQLSWRKALYELGRLRRKKTYLRLYREGMMRAKRQSGV